MPVIWTCRSCGKMEEFTYVDGCCAVPAEPWRETFVDDDFVCSVACSEKDVRNRASEMGFIICDGSGKEPVLVKDHSKWDPPNPVLQEKDWKCPSCDLNFTLERWEKPEPTAFHLRLTRVESEGTIHVSLTRLPGFPEDLDD